MQFASISWGKAALNICKPEYEDDC